MMPDLLPTQNQPMQMNKLVTLSAFLITLFAIAQGSSAQSTLEFEAQESSSDQHWQPIATPISTQWAEKVTPENTWNEYPRPQLVRNNWKNLNGIWDFGVTQKEFISPPEKFEGKILVPFSIESPLSGVGRDVNEHEAIWYRRNFDLDDFDQSIEPQIKQLLDQTDDRIFLHFEAVDWQTTVWINDEKIGVHEGGYSPFSFDITDVVKTEKPNTMVVKVWDPQLKGFKSLGKQKASPDHYQRCSGIWQTVWLERVPKMHLVNLKINGTADGNVTITPTVANPDVTIVTYEVIEDSKVIAKEVTDGVKPVTIKIPDAKLWSPESPHLYDVIVTVNRGEIVMDRVTTYFGLRSFKIGVENSGAQIYLNNEPIFLFGPLNQSYWPGGGLTPPNDEAMKWECQYVKDVGCNMIRMHVKQNPRRFYTHCDRMGLIVWQDFISPQTLRKRNQRVRVKPFQARPWANEQLQMMETLHNHPSIAMWVIFNESWGQHDSAATTKWVTEHDPSRLVNVASGWYDLPGVGTVRDVHDFTFHPSIPVLGSEYQRAVVLGQCGGFVSAVAGNNWLNRSNEAESDMNPPANPLFGGFDPTLPRDSNVTHDIIRPTFTTGKPLEDQYEVFINDLCLLKTHGLTAAVFTQLTDMKQEENGWLTFDRKVSKMDLSRMNEIHQRLYPPAKQRKPLIPRLKPWEYTVLPAKEPVSEKQPLSFGDEADFDIPAEAQWTMGRAPFGNSVSQRIATKWDGSKRLVIRRPLELPELPQAVAMQFYHYLLDEPRDDGEINPKWQHARVYINGKFVLDETTRIIDSEQRVAEIALRQEALNHLKVGVNEIAIEVMTGLDPKTGKINPPAQEVYFDFSMFEIVEGKK